MPATNVFYLKSLTNYKLYVAPINLFFFFACLFIFSENNFLTPHKNSISSRFRLLQSYIICNSRSFFEHNFTAFSLIPHCLLFPTSSRILFQFSFYFHTTVIIRVILYSKFSDKKKPDCSLSLIHIWMPEAG